MAKYDPISTFLRGATSPVTLRFAELDRLIGGLPPSARNHRSWWGNTHHEMHVHANSWVNVGWVVVDLDLNAERVTFARGSVDERPRLSPVRRPVGQPRPRPSTAPDGAAQLAAVLKRAGYPTTLHAVAAHTSMLHPSVVVQTNGQAVFAAVRRDVRQGEQVGSFGEVDGVRLMLDDNLSPTVAFLWAAGHGRGVDMQYNHLWTASRDRFAYTALWNLCATPAFLAKTTDGKNHPEVVAALRRRAFELYGYLPADVPEPIAPAGYHDLEWAPHPPPVSDLETTYRKHMASKLKDRVVVSARELGWHFSDWQPDRSV